MSQDLPGTPKACQKSVHANFGAPPFRHIVGEEPVTPATTVLQPESTSARLQTSLTEPHSTAIQSQYNHPDASEVEAVVSREQSTAHTQQHGPQASDADVHPCDLQAKQESTERQGACGPDEWETWDLPADWAPVPLFMVSAAPGIESEQLIVALTEPLHQHAFEIKSVQMDNNLRQGESVGIVRLKSEQIKGQTVPLHRDSMQRRPRPSTLADVVAVAKQAVQVLNDAAPAAGGQFFNATADSLEVCLCLANIPPALRSADAMKLALQQYGSLERVCMISNSAEDLKGYAIIEFSLPSQAKHAYDDIKHGSMVTLAASDHSPDRVEQPRTPLARSDDSSHDQIAVTGSVLVARQSQARHVSEYFSKVLFLTHVPAACLVDDRLKNSLSDAAQCTPEDISEIWTHDDVSNSFTFDATSDSRCGRPWGCVRFTRADHCDTAFRNLEKCAAKGDDMLRVVFAPPEFMSAQEATSCKVAPALPDFGIKGPGYAPGFVPASMQKPPESPGQLLQLKPVVTVLPTRTSMAILECAENRIATLQTVTKASTEAGQECSEKHTSPGTKGQITGCGTSGKGRPVTNTGSTTKPNRSQKRTHRGTQRGDGRLVKQRQPAPVHSQMHSRGPDGFHVVARPPQGCPSGFVPVRPRMYRPAPPPGRPVMAIRPGGYQAADTQQTCGRSSLHLPRGNAPPRPPPPPSIPPPVHMGQLVMTPQWVQPTPALSIQSPEYGRPEQQLASRHVSQYQGIEPTQQASLDHQSQMAPHAQVPQQAVQLAPQPLAGHSRYIQPVPHQGIAHHQSLSQQQVIPEVAPPHFHSASCGAHINHYSTAQMGSTGQLLQPQATSQPTQYTSSQSYQHFPVQHTGQNEARLSYNVQHVGQNHGFQNDGYAFPTNQHGTYAYNLSQNPGQYASGGQRHFGS